MAAFVTVGSDDDTLDKRLALAESNGTTLDRESKLKWQTRKRRWPKMGGHCKCCKGFTLLSHKRAHFAKDQLLEIGGDTTTTFESFWLYPAYNAKDPRNTADNKGWGTVQLVGASPTSAYSEMERRQRPTDHRAFEPPAAQPAAHKSCLKQDTALRAVPWRIDEIAENPSALSAHGLRNCEEGVELPPQSFLAACDSVGRTQSSASDDGYPTSTIGDDRGLNDGGDALSDDGSTQSETSSHGNYDNESNGNVYVPDDVVFTSRNVSDENSDGDMRPSAVSEAYWALTNALQRKAISKAYRTTLSYPRAYAQWASLSKRKRGQIRKARKLYKFAVDSGANVNTCTPETAAALFSPESIEHSGIRIGGLVGGVDVEEKGVIAGSVQTDDGTAVLLHHRDVHNCAGSTMNLLSASKLAQGGVRCVLDTDKAGGSYLLLPAAANGERRRVPLRYVNGLYLLEIEALYGEGDEDD